MYQGTASQNPSLAVITSNGKYCSHSRVLPMLNVGLKCLKLVSFRQLRDVTDKKALKDVKVIFGYGLLTMVLR